MRAELRSIRIKGLASIERKARAKGWQPDEALHSCSDLVGARVVCNNVEDVYRFAELLRGRLRIASDAFEVQDYIKTPNPGGYRALHINFRIDAGEHPFRPDPVPVKCKSDPAQDAPELCRMSAGPDLPADLRVRAWIWPCWPPRPRYERDPRAGDAGDGSSRVAPTLRRFQPKGSRMFSDCLVDRPDYVVRHAECQPRPRDYIARRGLPIFCPTGFSTKS